MVQPRVDWRLAAIHRFGVTVAESCWWFGRMTILAVDVVCAMVKSGLQEGPLPRHSSGPPRACPGQQYLLSLRLIILIWLENPQPTYRFGTTRGCRGREELQVVELGRLELQTSAGVPTLTGLP